MIEEKFNKQHATDKAADVHSVAKEAGRVIHKGFFDTFTLEEKGVAAEIAGLAPIILLAEAGRKPNTKDLKEG